MDSRILVNIDVSNLRHATEFYTQAFQLEVMRDLSKHGAIELTGNIFLLEKMLADPDERTRIRRAALRPHLP